MKNKAMFLVILLAVFLLPTLTVKASPTQTKICCGTSGLYSVQFDSSKNSEVSLSKINCDNVHEGHLNYPNGVEDEKYKFTATKISSQCITDGSGNAISCPKDSSLLGKIKDKYVDSNSEVTSNVSIIFNGNGLFNITIKDAFNGKYKVRYTINGNGRNMELSNSSNYSDFLTSSGGNFHINGIEANKSIGLEFYQNGGNDGCNGAFIGGIIFFTPDLTTVKVSNSMPNDGVCTQFKSWVPVDKNGNTIDGRHFDMTAFTNMKKNLVPGCYDKEITYPDSLTIRQTVNDGIEAFKKLYSGSTMQRAQGGRSCNSNYDGDTYVNAWSGQYWGYRCEENYHATTDNAKLVRAGDGFSYQAEFTVTRSCQKIKISSPPREIGCHYNIYCTDCSCDCTWVGASGTVHSGEDSAGPNDTFDKCVKECDGGKYSQNCINSCYSKVYKKSRSSKFSSNLTTKTRNNNIEFVADYSAQDAAAGGLVTTSSGLTSHNLPGTKYTMKIQGGKECSCTESFWCQNGHGSCTFHTWNYVCGTDWDYCNTLNARADAEEAFVNAAINGERINIDTSKFSMSITDSYLNNGTFKTTYTTSSQPALNVDVLEDSNTKAVVRISLPLSFVDKITGEAVYKSNMSSSTGMKLNSKKAIFESVAFGNNANDLARYYFTSGERKYYTNINSKNLNVVLQSDNSVALSANPSKWNITVSSGQNGNGAMGWARYGSDHTCYYGVYNNFYDDENPCNPTKEVCDGGIQYIFRPIELSDVFPNGRDPRYNWDNESKNRGNDIYKTVVDPIKYTKTIQTKQDDIYNQNIGEIDYEFILTPKNIAAIKNYNKSVSDFNKDGANNYLDYDLSCYNKNGKEICTSKFLDNTDIVTYGSGYTIDNRKSIAGCNNARENGTVCDTSAHQ